MPYIPYKITHLEPLGTVIVVPEAVVNGPTLIALLPEPIV